MTNKKTAVCLSGFPSKFDEPYMTLKDKLDTWVRNYDVFAWIPICDHSDMIHKHFPEATVICDEDADLDLNGVLLANPGQSTQTYLKQVTGWKRVNEMRKAAGYYDYVIRARPDLIYTNDWVDIDSVKRDRLYIPDFHHWGGINDRFCLGHTDIIDAYMNIIDDVRQNPKSCTHAETFLRKTLEKYRVPIQFVPIHFSRIRGNGNILDDRAGDNHAHYPHDLIRS